MQFSSTDRRHMARALRLACRGKGRVSPNPPVGCVIARGERPVGEGWHEEYGGAHAEVNALSRAGPAARGATAYVTLMPCAHEGKTPPCTSALLRAGVARVVAALEDPNPESLDGRAVLERQGVRVEVGLMAAEARRLARGFLHHLATGLPFLTLKWAMSLDGRIATRTGASKWISGERSRVRVQRMRARSDGVMVGVNTVLADDPRLNVRIARAARPRRIVVDSTCRLPPSARLLANPAEEGEVIVLTTPRAPASRARALERGGAQVVRVPAEAGRVDLLEAMRALAARGLREILCEGGGELAAGLLARGLAQEVVVFTAPRILGGREAPGPVGGEGAGAVREAVPLGGLRVSRCGEDFVFTAGVCRAEGEVTEEAKEKHGP